MSDEFDELPVPASRTEWPRDARGGWGAPMHRIPELIGDIYMGAMSPLRSKLLECLLQPVGTLGLTAIAAGAFGGLLRQRRSGSIGISQEDVSRFTPDHVRELARFVEQCAPETFLRVAMLLAENPVAVTGLTASAFLVALRAWRGQRVTRSNQRSNSPSKSEVSKETTKFSRRRNQP